MIRALKRLAALAALLVSSFLTAARAQPAADPARPNTFAAFPAPKADLPYLQPKWPSRWGRDNQPIQGVLIDMDAAAHLQGVRQGGNHIVDEESPDAKALREANVSGAAPPHVWISEGPGSFRYVVANAESPPRRAATPSALFRFVSAQLVPDHSPGAPPAPCIERTWFVVFDAIQGEGKQPRGTALLMPGLFGTPEGTLGQLTTQLRKNGWVVLRMLSQPSRFTEQVTFELSAGNDLEAQARHIAQVLGDRAAECAFATQAVFQHLEEKRPELKQLPRIAIGFSGGAITLPTVVAREPDRYSAFVLVGGGCDFWLMNEKSNYRGMIDAVHEKWDNEPTDADRARLDQLYLNNAPLDSYHTAQVLKGKKILMIQGSADLAVPSPLGDLLWERLGKPERWLVDGAGHEVLFMMLPQKFEKMMEWLVPPSSP